MVRSSRRSGFCTVDGDLVREVLAVGASFGNMRRDEQVVFNCTFMRSAVPTERHAHWLRNDIGPRLLQMVQRLRGTVASIRPRS